MGADMGGGARSQADGMAPAPSPSAPTQPLAPSSLSTGVAEAARWAQGGGSDSWGPDLGGGTAPGHLLPLIKLASSGSTAAASWRPDRRLWHDALGPCRPFLFFFFVYFHRLMEAGKQPPPVILIYYTVTLRRRRFSYLPPKIEKKPPL